MKTFAVALALALAIPAWAQDDAPRVVIRVRDGTLTDASGATRSVDAGLFLPTDTAVSVARELVGLRAENEALKKDPPTATPWQVVVAVLVGVVVGAGGVLYEQNCAPGAPLCLPR